MQANRNIHLSPEKAPICKLSRSKAPKTQQICHCSHTRKTSEPFLLYNKGVDFSLRNNFHNSGSFAKVSFPVHNYNSLVQKLVTSTAKIYVNVVDVQQESWLPLSIGKCAYNGFFTLIWLSLAMISQYL